MKNFTSKQIFFTALGTPILAGIILLVVFFSLSNFASAETEHIAGNKNAKVKLVEYSDFQCPYCEKAYPILKKLRAEYGDKISIQYKHFPLNFHPFAQKAAEASECAGEQGKFWEYHDKIFENQSALSDTSLLQWAKDIRLNQGKFETCLSSGKFTAKVFAEQKEGAALGVGGTPTTFINGEKVVGAQPYESFKSIIDNLLK